MPVGRSTGWCEKLCLWAILQRDANKCACGYTTEWQKALSFVYLHIFMTFEVPTAVNIQFDGTLAWDTAYWHKEITTLKKNYCLLLRCKCTVQTVAEHCETFVTTRKTTRRHTSNTPKFTHTNCLWIRFLNLWFVTSDCTCFVIEWLVTRGLCSCLAILQKWKWARR